MRALLVTVVLACASKQVSTADAGNFYFEGFSLGMSRSEASAVRPDVPWKKVMRGTSSEVVRKEFKSRHLAQQAEVAVDLLASGKNVGAIGFTFLTQTGQQCIQEAVQALAQLEKTYGTEEEVSHDPPGKSASRLLKFAHA